MFKLISKTLRVAIGVPVAILFALITYITGWATTAFATVAILGLWLAFDTEEISDDD